MLDVLLSKARQRSLLKTTEEEGIGKTYMLRSEKQTGYLGSNLRASAVRSSYSLGSECQNLLQLQSRQAPCLFVQVYITHRAPNSFKHLSILFTTPPPISHRIPKIRLQQTSTSPFPTFQYTSAEFVESAGCILFHLSQKKICLLHLLSQNEWLLPKGRRNCGESLQQAAVREINEETGVQGKLLSINLVTRAPMSGEGSSSDADDTPRNFNHVTEPFMITIRHLGGGHGVKSISWYIAHVDEEIQSGTGEGEPEKFRVDFLGYEETLVRLTFQEDKDIVRRALEIVIATYGT